MVTSRAYTHRLFCVVSAPLPARNPSECQAGAQAVVIDRLDQMTGDMTVAINQESTVTISQATQRVSMAEPAAK